MLFSLRSNISFINIIITLLFPLIFIRNGNKNLFFYRCFVSITTAFLLHQGVLMNGSKASGKTETLRELGRTTGNYVLVINCSESLTHLSLVRILSGIVQVRIIICCSFKHLCIVCKLLDKVCLKQKLSSLKNL